KRAIANEVTARFCKGGTGFQPVFARPEPIRCRVTCDPLTLERRRQATAKFTRDSGPQRDRLETYPTFWRRSRYVKSNGERRTLQCPCKNFSSSIFSRSFNASSRPSGIMDLSLSSLDS